MDLSRHTPDNADPTSTYELPSSADEHVQNKQSTPDSRVTGDIKDNLDSQDVPTKPTTLTPEHPTTGEPVLKNPTTGEPTSENPTTGDATLENSATGEPALENLTTCDPTRENPATVDLVLGNPTTCEPAPEKPISLDATPASVSYDANTGGVLTTVKEALSPSISSPQTINDSEKEGSTNNDQDTVTNVVPLQYSSESQPSCSGPAMTLDAISRAAQRETGFLCFAPDIPVVVSEPAAIPESKAEPASPPTTVSEHDASHASPTPSLPEPAPIIKDPATDHPLAPSPTCVQIPEQIDPVPSQVPIKDAVSPPVQPNSIKAPSEASISVPIPTHSDAPVQSPIPTPIPSEASINTFPSMASQPLVPADMPVELPIPTQIPVSVRAPADIEPSLQAPVSPPSPAQAAATSQSPVLGESADPVQASAPVSPLSQNPTLDEAPSIAQSLPIDKMLIPDQNVEVSVQAAEERNVDSLATPVQEEIALPLPRELSKQQDIDMLTLPRDGGFDIGHEPQKLVTETIAEKQAPMDPQDNQHPKLPQDAPPSMDDESLDTQVEKVVGSRQAINTVTVVSEEPMDGEGSLDVLVTTSSSEDNSKDAPPQDFKPFSNYTEDGKLISNAEGKSAEKVVSTPLSTTMSVVEPVEASVEPMSVDYSFPGAGDSIKSRRISMPVSSQFQDQFMDFLKCNDNATQHSFTGGGGGGENSGENSATGDGFIKPAADPTQGETMIGGEVTADGEVTTSSQIQDEGSQSCPPGVEAGSQPIPSTPRTGKKRGRKKKSEIEAQRLAEAASGEMPKPVRTLRKRKPKEPEKPKEDEQVDEEEKTTPETSPNTRKKATILGLVPSTFPAEKLFEYQWPQNKAADWFFLQEHLSSFLGVKSFKRKYPDLTRRTVGMPERNFLQESGVVSEMQCDLGLTSLKSDQVYELLLKDFPEKYKQYAQVLREREHARVAERKRLASEMAKMNKNDLGDVVKRAVRSAAEFNAQFMREKREERRAYFDLQTTEIHYPISTRKVLPAWATKVCAYPVSLIPGQFQEHFKKYTPAQMKYFPLNTATYDPPKHLDTIYADPNDKYESELDSQSASSQGDAENGSSSSGSSSESGSDGDSDSSSDAVEPEVVPPAPPPAKKPGRPPRGKKAAAVKDSPSVCNICQGSSEKNKIAESEELVKCAECGRHGHPSCLELTEEMIPNIKTYPWQCMECKTCVECMDPYDEDKMMFCDHCDRGYHTFCVSLRSIPTGRWECPSCRTEPPTKKRRRQQNVV